MIWLAYPRYAVSGELERAGSEMTSGRIQGFLQRLSLIVNDELFRVVKRNGQSSGSSDGRWFGTFGLATRCRPDESARGMYWHEFGYINCTPMAHRFGYTIDAEGGTYTRVTKRKEVVVPAKLNPLSSFLSMWDLHEPYGRLHALPASSSIRLVPSLTAVGYGAGAEVDPLWPKAGETLVLSCTLK